MDAPGAAERRHRPAWAGRDAARDRPATGRQAHSRHTRAPRAGSRAPPAQSAGPVSFRGAGGRPGGIHERGEVDPVQSAHRRRRAGRKPTVRHPGSDAAPARPRRGAMPWCSPIPSDSSASFPTISSRHSERPWKRRWRPSSSCTWWTPRRRDRSERIRDVHDVLQAIGAGDVPRLEVFNKCDELAPGRLEVGLGWPRIESGPGTKPSRVLASARTGAGIELVIEAIRSHAGRSRVTRVARIPPAQGRLRATIHACAQRPGGSGRAGRRELHDVPHRARRSRAAVPRHSARRVSRKEPAPASIVGRRPQPRPVTPREGSDPRSRRCEGSLAGRARRSRRAAVYWRAMQAKITL